MKKPTVTPSAPFDQIPRPNHRRKMGARTTRGSAFAIRMYGSSSAARTGTPARANPTITPRTPPITNDSIASVNVVERWTQIVPVPAHCAMRRTISLGRLKKNGSSHLAAAPHSHAPSTTAASVSWQRMSRRRLSPIPFIALQHFLPQVVPDVPVHLVEPGFGFDVDEIPRPRQVDGVPTHQPGARSC